MSHKTITSGFVKSVLNNGVGRYVGQVQRLTLKFCKSHADSRGMRDFIESHLLDFVHKNPGIVVYLQPRRHRTPRLVAEYLNGRCVQLYTANQTADELCQWIEHLRCRSGNEIHRLRKTWHTDTPSVQGIWTPFTNLSPQIAVKSLPDDCVAVCPAQESATDYLTNLVKDLNISAAVVDQTISLEKNNCS